MSIDRQIVSLLAHADHPIACPLSDASVARLLDALGLAPGASLLDVGCGEGEWLARVPGRGVRLTGVDLSGAALARARDELGPGARLVEAPAAEFLANGGQWDAVLCNGACHAFGGAEEAIVLLARHLAPGGVLLFSDGFWQVPPTKVALDALGASEGDIPTLGQVRGAIGRAGLREEAVHFSTTQEWDDYETAWCTALEAHADGIAADAPFDAARLRQIAGEHRAGYLEGYRGILGYVAIVARN